MIYRTYDMEASTRRMTQRNAHSILWWEYKCPRPIRIRLNKIADVPAALIRSWDDHAPQAIENWRNAGGLAIYRPSRTRQWTVPSDAMLFLEAPFQHEKFLTFTEHVIQDIVIYRPPEWVLHDDALATLYPTSEVHRTIDALAPAFCNAPQNVEQEVAVQLAGFGADKSAVFTAKDVASITGINERLMRAVLPRFGTARFHPYIPHIPPDDPHLRWAYDAIEAEPDVDRGTRLFKFNKPTQPVAPGFGTALKQLVKTHHVGDYDCIYVVNLAAPPRDYTRIDAVSNARRGQWWKMRNVVDAAPEYLDA